MTPGPLRVWTHPIILEFAAGMLLAVAFRFGARIPGWAAVVVAMGGVACIVLFANFASPPPPSFTLRPLVWGLPCVLIVVSATLGLRLNVPHLVARGVNALGDASYALYLIHPLMMAVIIVSRGRGYITGNVVRRHCGVRNHRCPGTYRVLLRATIAGQITALAGARRKRALLIGDRLLEVNK